MLPGSVGGTEIYLRHLIDAWTQSSLPHEILLFINRESADTFSDSRGLQVVVCPVRAVRRPERILWEQFRLPAYCRQYRVDVLFNAGFTAPSVSGCPSVTVFHDLQHALHPEWFRWWDRIPWNLLLGLSARVSTKILCVSAQTRKDFLKHYLRAPEDVAVVEHGVDEQFRQLQWEPDTVRPYVFCSATTHPHKNFQRLLHAFSVFRQQAPKYRLEITGVHGFSTKTIKEQIAALGLKDCVRLNGWLPREEFYRLCRGSTASIYPTLFEGFGMPVLESLAGGIPTACSDIEPLRTIAGSAVLRFNPHSVDAITSALRRICLDAELRRYLHDAGPIQAAPYSWTRTAAETLALLEQAAATRVRRAIRNS